jgi:hypothetical protein
MTDRERKKQRRVQFRCPSIDIADSAFAGGLLGLLAGLLGSGILLMIYRAIRQIRGKHDSSNATLLPERRV